MSDLRKLLEALKAELDFVNRGGYRKASWRPQFIFEDSPTCLNGRDGGQTSCSECVLAPFVPIEKRGSKVPCRYIRLNDQGETVDSLYRSRTHEELESTLRDWLTKEIQRLERARTLLETELLR